MKCSQCKGRGILVDFPDKPICPKCGGKGINGGTKPPKKGVNYEWL